MLDIRNKTVCRNIQCLPLLGACSATNTEHYKLARLHFIGSYQICPFQLQLLFAFVQIWKHSFLTWVSEFGSSITLLLHYSPSWYPVYNIHGPASLALLFLPGSNSSTGVQPTEIQSESLFFFKFLLLHFSFVLLSCHPYWFCFLPFHLSCFTLLVL